LLAQSSGGKRFRYLFDNGGDGSDYGATHAADCNYFCSQPGDCDGSGINTPEKVALGKELRRRWTTFAKTGVPAAGWPEVDKKKGRLAVPMLNIDMKGQTVRHSAWFSNTAAQLLADLACGKKGVEDFDCGGTLPSPPMGIVLLIVVVIILLAGIGWFGWRRAQAQKMANTGVSTELIS